MCHTNFNWAENTDTSIHQPRYVHVCMHVLIEIYNVTMEYRLADAITDTHKETLQKHAENFPKIEGLDCLSPVLWVDN